MAVKNALAIKKLDPRPMSMCSTATSGPTASGKSTTSRRARPAWSSSATRRKRRRRSPTSNGLVVTLKSPDFPEPIAIEADHVVLSTGVEVDLKNNKRISDMLKVPLNADGFYVEAHMKLRPVDFATEGIFLCGLAHSPKFIDENIAQARAAAARAATVLSKTQLDVSAQVSYVDQQKCISCMTCVTVCSVFRALLQQGRQGADRGRQVHGLRHLRRRVSGPRHPAAPLRDRPVRGDDQAIVRRRTQWKRGKRLSRAPPRQPAG